MQSDEFEYADLLLTVLLAAGFAAGLSRRGHSDPAWLTARLEESLRERYPGASVTVRVQEGLDGDWSVQVAEVAEGDLADFVIGDLNLHLPSLLEEAAFPELP